MSDPDEFSPVQASIVDGYDSDLFMLTQLGELMTVSPIGLIYNEEEPAKNLFEISLLLEDADMNNTYQLVIEVLDMDENPPLILTGNSPALHQLSVPENTSFVYELKAQDIEKDILNYSIQSGLDANLFDLKEDSNSSAILSFKESPNYELPFVSLLNNGEYQVVLGVSDGLNVVEQLVTVTVTDANDPPILLKSIYNLLEDDRSFTDFLDVFDEDNDSVTISINESTSGGTINLQDKQIFYLPDNDFYGTDLGPCL